MKHMAEKIVVKRLAQPGENVNAEPGSKQTPAPAGGRNADVPQQNETKAVSPGAAKRRKLFVHIGMHKTGTTSIQYFLNANVQRLNSIGYVFPFTGRHPNAHVQHALIAELFTEKSNLPDALTLGASIDAPLVLKAFKHEIELANKDNVIISSEMFVNLAKNGVEDFGAAFREFDITPIVYVRNFSDLVDGWYQTLVMHYSTLRSFRESGLYDWMEKFDLVETCRNWARISGGGKIIVQNYDDPEHKNSIVSFMRLVGIDASKMDNSQLNVPLNSSVSAALAITKRDMVGAGIELKYVDALVAQLKNLPMRERQTLVPLGLRREMTKNYNAQIRILAECDFVEGDKVALVRTVEDEGVDKIFIPNIQQAMFAIGRAVARAKFQTS
ncbi:MAG: hypothetical protein B7Y80_19965 [Hyphomicrobium sp. 32-62-53]|nr:MAG: hypothetical protein B7Y80_19965 [Hyphomicrobium sp. 32-62-53]